MIVDKTIVLGITGGVAAYKAADLASKLRQAGAKVRVVMTQSATEFIAPLIFSSLTGNDVITDIFESTPEFRVPHIGLAEVADVVVIAPATANTIAKLAAGIADNILCATVLATEAPVIVAPAMNVNMFQNSVTQDNLAKLKARGFTIIDPAYGRLASGKMGRGRLADVEAIIGTIKQVLGRSGDLAGKRIVVTAGGTQEAIDPVRYISNRSSGKMGYAVADAARDRGAEVTLITAPTALAEPVGIEVVHITSAVQMKEAVTRATAQADALIMAAAVADYQPKSVAGGKIKKAVTGESLTLELTRTPDILAETRGDFVRVGFAAETEDIVENAMKKLESKQLDIIVANDVTAPDSGFGVDTNRVTLISRDGKIESLPLMSKREVADRILDKVVELLASPSPVLSQDSFESTVQRSYIDAGYIHVPKTSWGSFPKVETTLELEIDKGDTIQTGCYIGTKIHGFRSKNIRQWYKAHCELNPGDKLIIRVTKPMEKYHLEIPKK